MTELAAWVAFPLVTALACLGTGLLAERLSGLRLEPALVAPVGLCGALVVVGAIFAAGGGVVLAGIGLALAASAGIVSARGELGRFRPGPGALAAGAAYALHIAPVAFTGTATFLGYNLLNDTAVHLALVDYLTDHGAGLVELPPSSYAAAIEEYVGRRYPLGSHELLAVLRLAVPVDPAALYQPFLAASMALAASAVFAVVRAAGIGARAAAGAAFVTVAGQLLFSFGLQGSIKELPLVAVLAAAAGLAPQVVRGERRAQAAALVGVAGAALYSIYGIYALPWLAPLGLLLAFALWREGRTLRPALAGVAAFALAAGPYFAPSIDYYSHHAVLESAAELGPLSGPVNPLQASGVWLNGDYRFDPTTAPGVTFVLALLALAGAVYGAVVAVRRRAWGPLAFLIPALVAWAAAAPRGSPYADAKLLAILCPPLVLFALLGWGGLRARRLRVPALAAVAGAILVSDALAYRVALPAPIDRLEELEAIGDRFRGRGPVLVNEFEEYVKHFGRDGGLSGPYERWNAGQAVLRAGVDPRPSRDYKLDELAPAFVQAHRVLVTRRSPAEDRPPSNYALARRGRWYDAWERRGPAPARHIAYGSRFSAAGFSHCGPLERRLGDGEFTGFVRPVAIRFDIARHRPLPPGWYVTARNPLTLDTTKGGSVFAQAITGPGRHEFWVRGRLVRRASVYVDGRFVGSAQASNRAAQWTRMGAIELRGGAHRVELRRPTRSLRPGDAAVDVLGPVVAVEARPGRLVRTREPRDLCGRGIDWVDVRD